MVEISPYDEVPYYSQAVEWTAPERLALASLLHGGPRPPLDAYRVLELGCADGANLLPLAYYRRQATFVGVDGAQSQIAWAEARRAALGLSNVELIAADFRELARRPLEGRFDYIIMHGVFSWVPADVRELLLELCADRLRPGGLLCLSYNTRPGWNMRGLVREILLAQTAVSGHGLRLRAERAQEVSAALADALSTEDHPYSRLLANELRMVTQHHVSYVAHEFLAPDNDPFWRSEFLALARQHRLDHVADADFNYSSGRVIEGLPEWLAAEGITGRSIEDTVDLLSYRHLHCPILTLAPVDLRPADGATFAGLLAASCLTPCEESDGPHPTFVHPAGSREVEAKSEAVDAALRRLQPLWPRGLPISELFADPSEVIDELKLLHRDGLIELRCVEPGDFGVSGEALNRLEAAHGDTITTAYHTRELVAPGEP